MGGAVNILRFVMPVTMFHDIETDPCSLFLSGFGFFSFFSSKSPSCCIFPQIVSSRYELFRH